MPDLSMCKNNRCPSALKCYRFIAVPDAYQSYGSFEVPVCKKKCSDFIKINKTDCTLQDVLIEDAIYNYNRLENETNINTSNDNNCN